MRAVNLLPAAGADKGQNETQSRSRRRSRSRSPQASCSCCSRSLLGLAFTQTRANVSDRQATLHGLEAEVAQNEAAAAVTAAAAAQMRAHYAAVTAAATGRTAWDRLLGQLSRVMPAAPGSRASSRRRGCASRRPTSPRPESTGSAVVTSNGLSSSSAATAPTAGTFTVTGLRPLSGVVARVLDRLALIPALSDVSLQTTQRTTSPARRQCNSRSTPTCVQREGIG